MSFNPLALLRLRNILDQSNSTVDQPRMLNPTPNPNQDMMDFQPEHGAIDKFTALMDQFPQRPHHNIWARLAGAGIDAIHPGEGTEALNRGYNNSLTDWKAQIGPAEQAASIERQTNSNTRLGSYQIAENARKERSDQNRFDTDQSRIKETERHNQETERHGREMVALQQFKLDNPQAKYDFSGPYVLVTDGQGVHNTGVETGKLSDLEKLNLQHENKTAEIKTAGEQARTTAEAKGEITKDVNIAKGNLSGFKTQSELEKRRVYHSNADKIRNSRPELSNYIHIGKLSPDDIQIDPPGRFRGPTPAQYEEINKFIYGTPTSPGTQPNPSTSNSAKPTGANVATPNPTVVPPEFGKESGVTKVGNKYQWKTEHGSFEWDGHGWVKVG